MRKRIRQRQAWRALLLAAWLGLFLAPMAQSASDADEESGAPHPVKLEAAEQKRLGVAVTQLTAANPPSGVTTIARVLDPGPLLALDSELASAVAAQSASAAQAGRTRKLYSEDRTASARAVETADATAQADRERAESARRRLSLEWGDGIGSLTPAKRAALLNDLSRVRAELVRVELPVGVAAPKAASHLELRVAADSEPIDATVLGVLPAADPRLQTSGVLVVLRGAQATLPIGRMLTAKIPAESAAQPAVVLPRGALLRKDSKVWVYVQTASASFMRREVAGYTLGPDGWFVREGFAPGERVVSAGAASLFAIESPAEAAD
jgi:hypothetical protein